jgi:hypothetical protein
MKPTNSKLRATFIALTIIANAVLSLGHTRAAESFTEGFSGTGAFTVANGPDMTSVAGFEANGWTGFAGSLGNLGSFNTVAGTYDVPGDSLHFVVTQTDPVSGDPIQDIYQSLQGLFRAGRTNLPQEFFWSIKNISVGTAGTQLVGMQLNYSTFAGADPLGLEFFDLPLFVDGGDWNLARFAVTAIHDGIHVTNVVPLNGTIVTELQYHVLITPDLENGGSNVLAEVKINSDDNYTNLLNLTGLQFPVDLRDSPNVSMNLLTLGQEIVEPFSLAPTTTGPTASWDFAQGPAPPFDIADFNQDGIVNDDDYLVWKEDFGSTTVLAADANRNKVIDAADYTIWRNRFGSVIGGSGSLAANIAAIPEPTALLLSATGVVLLLGTGVGRAQCMRKLNRL